MFNYTTLLYVILNLETRAKRANRAAHNNHAPVEADITPKVEEVRVDTANVKVGSRTAELLTSFGSCAFCLHDPVLKMWGVSSHNASTLC
jgi:hypothetical protein